MTLCGEFLPPTDELLYFGNMSSLILVQAYAPVPTRNCQLTPVKKLTKSKISCAVLLLVALAQLPAVSSRRFSSLTKAGVKLEPSGWLKKKLTLKSEARRTYFVYSHMRRKHKASTMPAVHYPFGQSQVIRDN